VEAGPSLSILEVQALDLQLETSALVKEMLKNATWQMQPIAMDSLFVPMETSSGRHAQAFSDGQQ